MAMALDVQPGVLSSSRAQWDTMTDDTEDKVRDGLRGLQGCWKTRGHAML